MAIKRAIVFAPAPAKQESSQKKTLHLTDQGIPPNQILALTFSDKAAAEMSDCIEEKRQHLDPGIHTFHSLCLDILKENVLASGLSVSGGIISRTMDSLTGPSCMETHERKIFSN